MIYNICDGLSANSNAEGFTYYSNSGCDGDEGSYLSISLIAGTQYFVRIRSEEDCSGLEFELTYEGPIVGCTDQEACNYDPFAEIDAPEECVYEGAACNGPDLKIMVNDIQSSLFLTTINNSDGCMINEGCLTGYGEREIIRFTTRIENIGEQDYYIGYAPFDVATPSTQFNYDNCHNHWHYKGYAEYLVFDDNQDLLPVGFKAGFCVMDLDCSYGGGTAAYGCAEMGISAHCGDIYDSSLDCQWIDVTDLEAGVYTLVVRINWDQDPDFLGRQETDYTNNWGQVCFELFRDQNGVASGIQQIPQCEPFVDCAGTLYGAATIDCEGNCGGSAIFGDMNQDGNLGTLDVLAYYAAILDQSILVNGCNDLNGDGQLTVADATLLAGCALYSAGQHQHPDGSPGAHSHCDFPRNVENPFQEVSMQLGEVNEANHYFDVEMVNPNNRVLSYDYQVSGVTVTQVQNIYFEDGYNPNMASNAEGRVMALPIEEQNIQKNIDMVPITRIYYSPLAPNTSTEICLEKIEAVTNTNYEIVGTVILGECKTVTSAVNIEESTKTFSNFMISPNPVASTALVSFDNIEEQAAFLEVRNTAGQIVLQQSVTGSSFEFDRSDLAGGIYLLSVQIGQNLKTSKIVLP